MTNIYPIRFTAQLRQHLRALRKKRALTQAQVGAMVGVSQARIAEIEANPGLVSLDQLMQLLSVLDVSLFLNEAPSAIEQSEKIAAVPQEKIASAYSSSEKTQRSIANNVAQQSPPYVAPALVTAPTENADVSVILSDARDALPPAKKGSW